MLNMDIDVKNGDCLSDIRAIVLFPISILTTNIVFVYTINIHKFDHAFKFRFWSVSLRNDTKEAYGGSMQICYDFNNDVFLICKTLLINTEEFNNA